MENQVETKEKSLTFWIVLLAALMAGVILVFTFLKIVIPQPEIPEGTGDQIQVEEQEQPGSDLPAPSFCTHCGEGLPESFDWGQYCPFCGKLVE